MPPSNVAVASSYLHESKSELTIQTKDEKGQNMGIVTVNGQVLTVGGSAVKVQSTHTDTITFTSRLDGLQNIISHVNSLGISGSCYLILIDKENISKGQTVVIPINDGSCVTVARFYKDSNPLNCPSMITETQDIFIESGDTFMINRMWGV